MASKLSSPSPRVGQLLRAATLLIFLVAAGLVLLITLGVFDPQPLGEAPFSLFSGSKPVAAGQRQIWWLDEPLPPPPYSIHLVLQQRPVDSDAGLVLGDPEKALVVAVSPLGYVALWQSDPGRLMPAEDTYILPWQTWPHIRPNQNEIWLDVTADQVTVHLNREQLWRGPLQIDGQLGLTAAAHDEATVVRFEQVILWR